MLKRRICEEKMRDFCLNEGFAKRKRVIFGLNGRFSLKGGIIEEKMGDFCLNGAFSSGKRVIFELNLGFLKGKWVIFP